MDKIERPKVSERRELELYRIALGIQQLLPVDLGEALIVHDIVTDAIRTRWAKLPPKDGQLGARVVTLRVVDGC